MNAAHSMYALGLDETADLIGTVGHLRSVIVEGHIGTGKTSIEKLLMEKFPDYTMVRFDCTNKGLGDLFLPNMADLNGAPYVRFVPNEELGVHLDKPIILNFDEIGKADKSVIKGVRRVLLERMVGTQKLHPDSIVFATTNLGLEGLGDLLPAHTRNAVTIVQTRKPSKIEAIAYGLKHNFDPILLGWYSQEPKLWQTFDEVANPTENLFIFHPQDKARTSFFTPRSGEAASDYLKLRDKLSDNQLYAALMGTIGADAAQDLMAFVQLFDQLPSLESIRNDPHGAIIPTSASAICMVVYKVLGSLDRQLLNSWMIYSKRIREEARTMFVQSAMHPEYPHLDMVTQNADITQYAIDHNYMYQADKV